MPRTRSFAEAFSLPFGPITPAINSKAARLFLFLTGLSIDQKCLGGNSGFRLPVPASGKVLDLRYTPSSKLNQEIFVSTQYRPALTDHAFPPDFPFVAKTHGQTETHVQTGRSSIIHATTLGNVPSGPTFADNPETALQANHIAFTTLTYSFRTH